MSRIYYRGKLFDCPLQATNALGNLGVVEALKCVLSYVMARVRPPTDQSNFEGWVAAGFGWRLYRIFFKTYTEKVWGVPATEIQADWAAQRIKNLSLFSAVLNALLPRRNQKDIASLIEEFQYPKSGPGLMWERCAEHVRDRGGSVLLEVRSPRSSATSRAPPPSSRAPQTARCACRPRTWCPRCRSAAWSASWSRRRRPRSRPRRPTCATATSSPSRWSCRSGSAFRTTGCTSPVPRSGSGVCRTSARGRPTWSRTAGAAWAWSTS